MKLSAEEIDKRAESIANYGGKQKQAILKLIEDATGEKIPEPFDESKVVHGSVWGGQGYSVVLLADGRDNFLGVYDSTYPSEGDFRGESAKIIRELKLRNLRHLGRYDFSAGLPKGGAK